MTSSEKAQQTRKRNEELRARRYAEQAEATRTARLALTKVFQAPDATPEQVLRAAELLAELGKY